MKKIALSFFLLACLLACTQKKQATSETIDKLNSKYVRMVKDTMKMMLIENVVVLYGNFYAEADSAFYEKDIQTVTFYGTRNAKLNGKEVSFDGNRVVQYKKGGEPIKLD